MAVSSLFKGESLFTILPHSHKRSFDGVTKSLVLDIERAQHN